ncbi:hypothetical protein AGMMS49545_02110 [Betaproteobacteria bacterium]|nr:hypothetical protein AGMMS49545_02110 [Betaproteobacteria bacterium]GHU43846.1 hypothetical protein AGMMS50289_11000 [Betaproteobacteria bacterium]
MNNSNEAAAFSTAALQNLPANMRTRSERAQGYAGEMSGLLTEWIEEETRLSQPNTAKIAHLRAEQVVCADEIRHLRDFPEDKNAQDAVIAKYTHVLMEDRFNENKITSSGRYELREETKRVSRRMWGALYGQQERERRKPVPDQAVIARLEAEMRQCQQKELEMLEASVAEQKALIAQYEPLIWAIHQQREREASAQRTEPEPTADAEREPEPAEEAEAMTP